MAVLLAVPCAAVVWIHRVAERRWKGFGGRLEVLRKEVEAREGRRPVLRGPPAPGNAWEDYVPACKAYRQTVKKLPTLHPLDDVLPEEDLEILEAHLKANKAVLEQIQRGTHRANGDLSLDWEEGTRCRGRWPYPIDELKGLFRFHARQLVWENKDSKAAELLLDYYQFVRDRMNWPAQMYNVLSLTEGVNEDLRSLVVSRPLKARDLLEIDRELEILDSGLPPAELLLKMELLAFGYELRKPGLGWYGADVIPRRSLWRYGYSDRIAAVEGYERTERWVLDRTRGDAGPWIVVRDWEAALPWDTENHYFDLSRRGMSYGVGYLRSLRVVWRLLRVAAHFRATGDWLQLDDPYGTKLLHRIDGTRLRAWSVSEDGIDQGGENFPGDWNRHPPVPGKPVVICQDAVIEVTR